MDSERRRLELLLEKFYLVSIKKNYLYAKRFTISLTVELQELMEDIICHLRRHSLTLIFGLARSEMFESRDIE